MTLTHDPDAFREKLEYWRSTGGLNIAPSATPTRQSNRPSAKRWKQNPNYNAWERGVARDHRGMPILDEAGNVMGVKKAVEKRHWIDEQRRLRAAKQKARTEEGAS